MQEETHKCERSFDDRLARYGLKSDALNAETLCVTARATARLDAAGGGIAPARLLRPGSIAQLKEWIGVPQSSVARSRGKFTGRRTPQLPSEKLVARAGKVKSTRRSCSRCRKASAELYQDANVIHDAIHQYVYGDAAELTAHVPVLEAHVLHELPFWLFGRVVVEEDGVLEFGAGINTIVTDTLIIESGGLIRCEGSLKIDCRRIARS